MLEDTIRGRARLSPARPFPAPGHRWWQSQPFTLALSLGRNSQTVQGETANQSQNSRTRNFQLSANGPDGAFLDFTVTWHARDLPVRRVQPDAVKAALTMHPVLANAAPGRRASCARK